MSKYPAAQKSPDGFSRANRADSSKIDCDVSIRILAIILEGDSSGVTLTIHCIYSGRMVMFSRRQLNARQTWFIKAERRAERSPVR